MSPDPNVAAAVGISLGVQAGPLVLTLKEHGSVVRQAWFGSLLAGTDVITVIEGMIDDYCNE